jgi:hypothetical protein
MSTTSNRSVFIVRLRPEPYVAEPMNLLRWALKRLGRAGFRCLAVTYRAASRRSGAAGSDGAESKPKESGMTQ